MTGKCYTAREMTLDEYMDRLPIVHLARRELDAIRAQLAASTAHAEKAPELRAAVTKGQLGVAKRRALRSLDDWLEVTGAISDGSGWRWELEGIVGDAVEIGIQCAYGQYRKLEFEPGAEETP